MRLQRPGIALTCASANGQVDDQTDEEQDSEHWRLDCDQDEAADNGDDEDKVGDGRQKGTGGGGVHRRLMPLSGSASQPSPVPPVWVAAVNWLILIIVRRQRGCVQSMI